MACNAVSSLGVYESFLLTTVIMLNSKKNQVLLVGLPFLPTPILICSHLSVLDTLTKTNTETKHSITAFRSPQNKPALKIKVTNIISSKSYLSLQLSRSVLHVSMNSRWRGELMFLRGLESPETLLNFTSPLHCPSLPPLSSFNLLTLQAAVGNQESIRAGYGGEKISGMPAILL